MEGRELPGFVAFDIQRLVVNPGSAIPRGVILGPLLGFPVLPEYGVQAPV